MTERTSERNVRVIGNLFTVAELAPESLREALADMLAVPDKAVDVADADGDQEKPALGRSRALHLPHPPSR